MKLIVITHPQFLSNEAQLINSLFESGLEILHLRKPHSLINDYEQLLKDISSQFYSRITIHEHAELCERYELRGVHLNSRNTDYKGRGVLSKSCHSIEELKHIEQFEYVFLSPIFDSISKEGYGAAFSDNDLQQAFEQGLINEKVIALGGIDINNVVQLKKYGFGGAALLGYIWNAEDKENAYQKIKTIL